MKQAFIYFQIHEETRNLILFAYQSTSALDKGKNCG